MSKEKPKCLSWDHCKISCPLIKIDYASQLKAKEEKVLEDFVKMGFRKSELKKVMHRTLAAPQILGYRNKAKWVLDQAKAKQIEMGIIPHGGEEVVDISHCEVHAPAINKLSLFIKGELIKHKVVCGHKKLSEPALRYLIVRYSFKEKKMIVVFVTSSLELKGLDRVVDAIEKNAVFKKQVVAIVQNINSDSETVLLGEANKFYKKSVELIESLGSIQVPVGPLSSFQVNSLQAPVLYKRMKQLIGRGPFKGGVDLYSGLGLVALNLAPVTRQILAVEENGPMALEAIAAAKKNEVNNILELCAHPIEGFQTFLSEWGAPDWVCVNPPKSGMAEGLAQNIAQRAPKKLLYFSQQPLTLARDIRILFENNPNFVLKVLEPVDMFPQTEHISCLALIENTKFKRGTEKASPENQPKKGRNSRGESLH